MEWYPSVGHQPRAGAGVRTDPAGAEPVGLRRAGICRQTGRGDGLGARDNGLSGTGPPRHGALALASSLRQRAAGRPLRWGGGRRRLGSVRASPVLHRRPERISDLIKAIPSESRTAHVEKLRHAAGLGSPTRHSAALPTLLSPSFFPPHFCLPYPISPVPHIPLRPGTPGGCETKVLPGEKKTLFCCCSKGMAAGPRSCAALLNPRWCSPVFNTLDF